MDYVTRNRLILIGVSVCILIVMSLFILTYFRRVSNKIKNKSKGQLWINENRSMLDEHIYEGTMVTSNDKTENLHNSEDNKRGISYTMNINVLKWLYDDRVKHREILTHGSGSFETLGENDIISLAIDSKKNDILIKVNTIIIEDQNQNKNNILCPRRQKDIESESEEDIETETEILALKYFPLDEFFHVSIVLSKKRIDVYKDGKLDGTKIFKGFIPIHNKRKYPIKFFHGSPIRGIISNFMYFNYELLMPEINNIYNIGTLPNKTLDIDQQDLGKMIHASECGTNAANQLSKYKDYLNNKYDSSSKKLEDLSSHIHSHTHEEAGYSGHTHESTEN